MLEEGPSQPVRQKERQEEVYYSRRGRRKTDRWMVRLEDHEEPDCQP